MRIAIDVSPLESGHRVRGVGFYLENLKQSLVEYFPQNDYVFFTDVSQIPSDVDLIHFPYFDTYSTSLPSKNLKKTVVTVHDLTPIVFKSHFPPGLKGNIRWLIQKNRLKKVDFVITDSMSSKKDVEKIVGVSESKIDVVYLAGSKDFKKLEEKNLKAKLSKFDLPDKYLLYVGDVTWNKNLPRIVAAVKKTKFTLVMVGKALVNTEYDKSNPWNKDLVTVQKEIQGSSQFIALGFVSNADLNVLYNGASALLMPSIYEGFGLPVIEAMQAGCPVITSDGGSLKEVAGEAALFADPLSIDSITEKINDVMTQEKIREDLIKKGFKRAEKFSWEKTAKQTMDAYEKAIVE